MQVELNSEIINRIQYFTIIWWNISNFEQKMYEFIMSHNDYYNCSVYFDVNLFCVVILLK